jgi:CHASE2 domain-containing sensor protein
VTENNPTRTEPEQTIKTTASPSDSGYDSVTEKNITILIAIICICLLEVVAMLTNHDGVYFVPAVAIIAALAGYKISSLDILTKSP